MRGLVEVPLDAGSLSVEADEELEPGAVRVGRPGEVALQALQVLEVSLDQLQSMAPAVVDRFRTIACRPYEVVVEFGVKVPTRTSMVVAASSGEANLRTRLSGDRHGVDR